MTTYNVRFTDDDGSVLFTDPDWPESLGSLRSALTYDYVNPTHWEPERTILSIRWEAPTEALWSTVVLVVGWRDEDDYNHVSRYFLSAVRNPTNPTTDGGAK